MACCAAIAFIFAIARTAWARILGRDPVVDGFPPGGSWRSGPSGPPTAPAASTAGGGPSIGGPLAATVLAYGLLVHVLVTAGLASASGWVLRDAVLGALALALLRFGRRRTLAASALVGAGALWFSLGAVDMHVFGGFEFRTVPLVLDVAFHLSGWWLAIAAAGIVVVQRSTDASLVGDAA